MFIIGAQLFQTELKPVRRVSAAANPKRFQHKKNSKLAENQLFTWVNLEWHSHLPIRWREDWQFGEI